MKLVLLSVVLCVSGFGATLPCTLTPCEFAINIAWDTSGHLDTRPSTWGNTDSVSSEIPFVNVPRGYSVQIVHVHINEIAAPHGSMPTTAMAYALVGVTNTTAFQSPYVGPGLGSEGTCTYDQLAISYLGATLTADEDCSIVLNTDHTAIIKQAIFLDLATVPLHLEATARIRFYYIPTPISTTVVPPTAGPRFAGQ